MPYFYVDQTYIDSDRKQALSRYFRKNIKEHLRQEDASCFMIEKLCTYRFSLGKDFTFLVLSLHQDQATYDYLANMLKEAFDQDIKKAIAAFNKISSLDEYKYETNVKERDRPPVYSAPVPASSPKENTSDTLNITTQDILGALNHLSEIVRQYIGSSLTSNYWQVTRPRGDWFLRFKINDDASFTLTDSTEESVSAVQILQVREWTRTFIKNSSKFLKSLPEVVSEKVTDDKYKRMIALMPVGHLHEVELMSAAKESLFENTD